MKIKPLALPSVSEFKTTLFSAKHQFINAKVSIINHTAEFCFKESKNTNFVKIVSKTYHELMDQKNS